MKNNARQKAEPFEDEDATCFAQTGIAAYRN
jgi:hypothetical protein